MAKKGGARPGAGRPRKAVVEADATALIGQKIRDKLPEILDALINAAVEGDRRAAQYLVDRLVGRPAQEMRVTTDQVNPLDQVLEELKAEGWDV